MGKCLLSDEPDKIKTAYAPYICTLVSEMMGVGATLDDVTKVLRINKETLVVWRKRYPKFDKAIKEGLTESNRWNLANKEAADRKSDDTPITTPESQKLTIKKALYCVDSVKMATIAARNIYDPSAFSDGDLTNSPDIEVLYNELKKQITETIGGNTNCTQTMLMAQAKTLELLFNSMINNSLAAKHFDSIRYHMDIALRAQNQCRKTLLALEMVRNPPQRQIVGQQNIALNQQVNNGVLDTPRPYKKNKT